MAALRPAQECLASRARQPHASRDPAATLMAETQPNPSSALTASGGPGA